MCIQAGEFPQIEHTMRLASRLSNLNIYQHASVRTPFKSCCFSQGKLYPILCSCVCLFLSVLWNPIGWKLSLQRFIHAAACSNSLFIPSCDCANFIYPFYSPWATGEFPLWALTNSAAMHRLIFWCKQLYALC